MNWNIDFVTSDKKVIFRDGYRLPNKCKQLRHAGRIDNMSMYIV